MSNPTELPDLDKLEAYATSSKNGDWHATEAMLNMLDEDGILALVAAARRAQSECEASQAVYQYRNMKGGDWIECSSDSEAGMKLQGFGSFFEYRTLYTAPAASLSPLCGAQHAESGKEAGLTIGEAFKAVGGWMNGGELGYPSFGSMDALRVYTQKMVRSALAAQQAAAPANQPAQASTTRVTETKRAQLEARGYEVVGYVMQNSVNELCTLAHGRVEWLGKGTTSAPDTPEAPKGGE